MQFLLIQWYRIKGTSECEVIAPTLFYCVVIHGPSTGLVSRHNLIKQIHCATRTKFPAIKHLAFSLLWKSFRCCRKMSIWCNKTNDFITSPPVFVSRLLRFTFLQLKDPYGGTWYVNERKTKTNNMFLWCNIQFLCAVVKNLIVTCFVKVCHSYSITNFRLSRSMIFWFVMDPLHVEVSNWSPK